MPTFYLDRLVGVPRQENDVAALLCYRDGLTPPDRDWLDQLIQQGAYPGSAAESVEIVSGRLQSHGSEAETEGRQLETAA